MAGAGVLELILRTAVSLALVLAVIGAAYAIVRRRSATGARPRGHRRRAATPAIEVVGRAGLARSASAVALRFGDRVVMVGVSETARISVLAEIDAEQWDTLHPVEETLVPTSVPAGRRAPSPSVGAPPTRPSFFDALRDATIRRG